MMVTKIEDDGRTDIIKQSDRKRIIKIFISILF